MTLWINGQWVCGEGQPMQSIDPAKNTVCWEGQEASTRQIDHAVDISRRALSTWALQSYDERCAIVTRYTQLLEQNKESMALAIAQDTGKCLWETRTEVAVMIKKTTVSQEAYQERTGTRQSDLLDGRLVVRHRPHGVVVVFGPFNFPGHLPNGHIIPALLAGNVVLLKPSELTPMVAEKMAQLWEKAGLPPGVLQLLQGKVDVGKALAAHPSIDGLFFTGSSKTGHLLAQQFAHTPEKMLALEMGGNNPLVVDEINDIDAAVYHIIQSAFVTTGQRCTCARRLFVPDTLFSDQLLECLTDVTRRLAIGVYDAQPQPFMGSLISTQAAEHLLNVHQRLQTQVKKNWLSMERMQEASSFVTPAILEFEMSTAVEDQEFFGPLLQVYRYQDFDQAIMAANQTRYGLSAGLLSHSQDRWRYFLDRIQAGVVNWNGPTTGAPGHAPFGGVGASGNHRPSAYYAADYCAYPLTSIERDQLKVPENTPPGFSL